MPAPAYALEAIKIPLPAELDAWRTAADPTLTITYSFENQDSAEFFRTFPGFTPWTEAQKEAVRWGLREYESVINVRYVEVPAGSADPDIVFGRADLDYGGDTRLKASFTLKTWDASIVWDRDRDLTDPSARYLILHELGHAMLLKHAGNYDVSGGTPAGPFLPEAEDQGEYTVMSYWRIDGGAAANQLQLYDIAALQSRWGANTHEAAGDSVYTFNDDPGIFAIWDTGGTDRIDAAGAAAAADIDLNEGAFTRLAGQARMSVAWGSAIEDATGGDFADHLRGNALANRLVGGAGGDTIDGGGGNNFLRGGEGDDQITGGADTDDAQGNMGNDTIAGGEGADWVVGGKDNDLLYGDAGFDVVYGNLGDDTVEGGDGPDWVRGGQGNDIVRGGAGDDFIAGDRGDDTLTGGAGADLFHSFADAGLDRILDFNAAEGDRLNLLAGSQYALSQLAADTVIALTGGAQVVLVGVTLASLPSGWIFVG